MEPKKLTKKEILLLKMKQEDKKKQDYKIRHQFWQEKALQQFGNANNFFLGVNIFVFGYFVKEAKESGIKLSLCINDWGFKETLLGICAFFAFLSVLSGCITVLTRLFDLRLTRHISDLKKRDYDSNGILGMTYDKKGNNIGDTNIEIYLLWKNFFKTVFGKKKTYWIDSLTDDRNILLDKFHNLRKRTNQLGRFSWLSFKWQILWLLASIILYFIITFIIP